MTPSTQLENQGMEANEEYDSQTAQLLNYQVELKKEKQKKLTPNIKNSKKIYFVGTTNNTTHATNMVFFSGRTYNQGHSIGGNTYS